LGPIPNPQSPIPNPQLDRNSINVYYSNKQKISYHLNNKIQKLIYFNQDRIC
jgi:hypothetical protein